MGKIDGSQHLNITVSGGSRVDNVAQISGGSPSDGSEPSSQGAPARLLFLASDPYSYSHSRLRLDLEMKAVGEALRAGGSSERLALEHCLAPTFHDLQSAILRIRPRMLHFSGHGTPSGDLVFERDHRVPRERGARPGSEDTRPAEALSNLLGSLEAPQIRCAVLNACFSEVQAHEVAHHVGCVIGLFAEVKDSSAIEFARGFYCALTWGQSIGAAFDQARAQIGSRGEAGLYRLIADRCDPRSVKLF